MSIIPATLKGNKRKIKNQKIILVGSILHLPIAHSKECEILMINSCPGLQLIDFVYEITLNYTESLLQCTYITKLLQCDVDIPSHKVIWL